jgi:hypothetical protein
MSVINQAMRYVGLEGQCQDGSSGIVIASSDENSEGVGSIIQDKNSVNLGASGKAAQTLHILDHVGGHLHRAGMSKAIKELREDDAKNKKDIQDLKITVGKLTDERDMPAGATPSQISESPLLTDNSINSIDKAKIASPSAKVDAEKVLKELEGKLYIRANIVEKSLFTVFSTMLYAFELKFEEEKIGAYEALERLDKNKLVGLGAKDGMNANSDLHSVRDLLRANAADSLTSVDTSYALSPIERQAAKILREKFEFRNCDSIFTVLQKVGESKSYTLTGNGGSKTTVRNEQDLKNLIAFYQN